MNGLCCWTIPKVKAGGCLQLFLPPATTCHSSCPQQAPRHVAKLAEEALSGGHVRTPLQDSVALFGLQREM
jgi:hypothetical protein